jgi:hypothetical protein
MPLIQLDVKLADHGSHQQEKKEILSHKTSISTRISFYRRSPRPPSTNSRSGSMEDGTRETGYGFWWLMANAKPCRKRIRVPPFY